MKIPLQELQILHNSVAPWYCENKTNLFSYTSRVWHLMKMFRGIFIYMYTYMSYHRSNFLSNPRCSFSDVNLMCNIWRFNNTTPPPPFPLLSVLFLRCYSKKGNMTSPWSSTKVTLHLTGEPMLRVHERARSLLLLISCSQARLQQKPFWKLRTTTHPGSGLNLGPPDTSLMRNSSGLSRPFGL